MRKLYKNPIESRRGSTLILTVFSLSMMIGFLAFAIDIGYVSLAKGQLQNACDAAALASNDGFGPRLGPDTHVHATRRVNTGREYSREFGRRP